MHQRFEMECCKQIHVSSSQGPCLWCLWQYGENLVGGEGQWVTSHDALFREVITGILMQFSVWCWACCCSRDRQLSTCLTSLLSTSISGSCYSVPVNGSYLIFWCCIRKKMWFNWVRVVSFSCGEHVCILLKQFGPNQTRQFSKAYSNSYCVWCHRDRRMVLPSGESDCN